MWSHHVSATTTCAFVINVIIIMVAMPCQMDTPDRHVTMYENYVMCHKCAHICRHISVKCHSICIVEHNCIVEAEIIAHATITNSPEVIGGTLLQTVNVPLKQHPLLVHQLRPNQHLAPSNMHAGAL